MVTRNLNQELCFETLPAGRWDGGRVGSAVLHAVGTLRLWLRRSRQRAELRRLIGRDAAFFRDIGIPRATVYNEAGKWFWQA